MPRQKRQLSESGIYHIMLRGNERKELFLDDEDKLRFLETLDRMGSNHEFQIYAYCLMSNHVHLLIKEIEEPIQRSIKRISVSYAYYFNHKYARIGHLFQDRFKSERIENDSYIISCTKYIHHNPVKAGIVEKEEQYKWSSYRQYITCNKQPSVRVNREFVLGLYSQDINKAIKLFVKDSYMESQNVFIGNEDEVIKSHKKGWDVICSEIKERYDISMVELVEITDKKLRDRILKEIKSNSKMSLNELSRKTGVSKYIIFRA